MVFDKDLVESIDSQRVSQNNFLVPCGLREACIRKAFLELDVEVDVFLAILRRLIARKFSMSIWGW